MTLEPPVHPYLIASPSATLPSATSGANRVWAERYARKGGAELAEREDGRRGRGAYGP